MRRREIFLPLTHIDLRVASIKSSLAVSLRFHWNASGRGDAKHLGFTYALIQLCVSLNPYLKFNRILRGPPPRHSFSFSDVDFTISIINVPLFTRKLEPPHNWQTGVIIITKESTGRNDIYLFRDVALLVGAKRREMHKLYRVGAVFILIYVCILIGDSSRTTL